VAEFDDEIRAFYDRGEEASRLETIHPLEGERTRELLERFLPSPPASIIDVGGGPGAYAVWLAGRGYDVHLVDPVPLHVEQALAASRSEGRPLASAVVGDARRLERPDDCADAVLLLGPLYHLTERAERLRALAEARRVLRPGGPLLAAAISRFASLIDGLVKGFLTEPAFEAIVERDLEDGQHRNPTREPRWFTTAYFHLPGDLERELLEAGLKEVEVLAIEGPGVWLHDPDDWLADDERRELLLRTLRRIEREPSALGAGSHLLGVGRA
jgi:ubiquinone/menaquinone biosynthesis C-methylase UbiE